MSTSPSIPPEPGSLTDLLTAAGGGDPCSRERLFGEAYSALERLARNQLRRYPNRYLDPCEVIHEAFLRLGEERLFAVRDEDHFWALWSRAMRHVLLDGFRRDRTARRGGGHEPEPLGNRAAGGGSEQQMPIGPAVRQAVARLADANPRHARVVRLRVLGGLTRREIASVLNVSASTVKRDWAHARANLARELAA